MALSDALEKLIDEQQATDEDREAAYEAVKRLEEDTAEYAFARAALAGRLAQVRGLTAIGLVAEAEKYARLSRKLDPDFRDRAAQRMLGTLYVMAPAALVEHGDSETGLELLEELVDERPDRIENRLRLAEGYVVLDDPEPAFEHLCWCLERKSTLRPDAQRLLAQVVEDAGGVAELGCQD
ncbi:MAG: hypothetical protein JRI23_09060 [Deltaproteobacteria bacterium]|jgi:thioredoxin-like negative regulator of GroEL|nr:hypothetical protein [Deltaproteobacteria bacterium]